MDVVDVVDVVTVVDQAFGEELRHKPLYKAR